MAALVSVTHALVQHGQDIILSRALNDHQVLNKEAILNVPPWLEHSRRWIEQVTQLFIVNLEEARLDVELLLAHGHGLPHVPD